MRETVYGHKKRIDFFLSAIRKRQQSWRKPETSTRILDVGCGTGVMVTRPLARCGYQVVGIDVDAASIGLANRPAGDEPLPNLSFVAGRLEDQDWRGAFDVVICSEVLEHLKDPTGLIALLKERLSPDGILLITVPNGYGLFELDSHLWTWLHRIRGFWRIPALVTRGRNALFVALGRNDLLREMKEEDNADNISTLNEADPHCQSFTYGGVVRLFRQCGLRLVAAGKSSLWSGPFAHTVMRGLDGPIRLNVRLADLLPFFMSSGMYFCFERRPIESG